LIYILHHVEDVTADTVSPTMPANDLPAADPDQPST